MCILEMLPEDGRKTVGGRGAALLSVDLKAGYVNSEQNPPPPPLHPPQPVEQSVQVRPVLPFLVPVGF